jgi:hypothetical protein
MKVNNIRYNNYKWASKNFMENNKPLQAHGISIMNDNLSINIWGDTSVY